jgi:hypothetical protein
MITRIKIKLYNWLAKDLGKLGRDGDTELAHVNAWEQKLLKAVGGSGTINPITNLKEFKGGGGQSQSSSNEIDPMLKPYIEYGLNEAQNLYNQGAPEYYSGNTYLGPNQAQQDAMAMMTNQANAGSNVLTNSSALANQTLSGDFLNAGNPYLAQATQAGADVATDQYNKAMQNTNSQASLSGRYGSNAHANLASDNSQNLANALTNQAGTMAYNNYNAERQNQMNVMNNAQNIAGNDYYGANQLMNAGNQSAQFDQAALDADIARHDYGQNAQQMHLNNYLTAAYGAPGGSQTTTSSSGGGK